MTLIYPLPGEINADLVAQVKATAGQAPLLVDGFMSPTGERPQAPANMFSDKHHESGFNVQVVGDTCGRLVDVGDPVPGARHDAYAFTASGIAQHWAGPRAVPACGEDHAARASLRRDMWLLPAPKPGAGLRADIGQHRGDQADPVVGGGVDQQIGRRVAGVQQVLVGQQPRRARLP